MGAHSLALALQQVQEQEMEQVQEFERAAQARP